MLVTTIGLTMLSARPSGICLSRACRLFRLVGSLAMMRRRISSSTCLFLSQSRSTFKMYTRTIVAGHKLLWSLLFWLVVQNVFTAAAPTLSSILKRDAAEFLNGVSTRFQNAIPVATQAGIDLLNTVFGTVGGGRSMYTIPQQASVTASIARSASILTVRTNFLYGSPVGGGPYYPSGLLGVAKDAADAASIQIDLNSQIFNAATDLAQAVLDSQKVSMPLI